MTTAAKIDLAVLARELDVPIERVEVTLQLLEDGNTIPFITRYRKDRTGGLNEEQIQRIEQEAGKLRLLAERQQSILRSIESQGKLTPELAAKINSARTLKWLEDVYLPYKPKKQTLATIARQQGLEPLAKEVLDSDPMANDLRSRAAVFLTTDTTSNDRGLPTVEAVLQGVGHLLAEAFSERVDIRARLRKSLRREGVLVCSRIEPVDPPSAVSPLEQAVLSEQVATLEAVATPSETPAPMVESSAASKPEDAATVQPADHELASATPSVAPPDADTQHPTKKQPTKKQLAKERKKKLLEHAFKDYYQFREAISRLPPHRTLAINRGERAKVLRIRIEYDAGAMVDDAIRHLVPEGHPHGDFLRSCARDALHRLVLPSLERELRRELAEESEQHAVQVFIRNLRKLLLQPPVRGKRVLAVDPGFRSGCKLAAIDAFGNVLEHGMIHLVGNDDQRRHARANLAEIIRRNQLDLVAIGNGAGCRSAEHIVADVIGNELSGTPIAYLIVNEAGASVYSTSQIGRDELPNCDPMMRSAISIGRRLQDPLSELVKINPANIGVGMYQHDMKVKHLRESLDGVVHSCVNFVGVELNTASPSLLGYVSGLNQLTARRIYEHRRQHGPFRTREQLKDVPGIGEATFIQAAGFLRISDGDNPLDSTWIHPESYEIATRMLERLHIPLSELTRGNSSQGPPTAVQTSHSGTGELPPPGDSQSADSQSADSQSADSQSADSQPADSQPGDSAIAARLPSLDPEAAVVPMVAAAPSAEAAHSTEDVLPACSWMDRLAIVNVREMSAELQIGELLLSDILTSLARPGRDPRDDFSPPPFRTSIMKLENLKPGMELQGTVLNVVDFGAFVDIGMSDSALIHISKLADQFIRDPQEVVSVGDIVRVWVIDVDRERRRVSLTAIDPHAERRPRDRHDPKARRVRPPQQQRPPRQRPPQTSPPQRATENGGAETGGAETGGAVPPQPPTRFQQPRPPRPPAKKPPYKSPPYKSPPYKSPPYKSPAFKSQTAPPPKPKPVRPITPAMLTGKQPMRSFSDLLQFYEKKPPDAEQKKE